MKAIILVILTLAAILIVSGCVADTGENVNTDITLAETTLAEETTAGLKAPDVPETDMEGKIFTIYTQSWYDYAPLQIIDIITEELTGDSLIDATFNRNIKIEQLFDCKVEVIESSTSIDTGLSQFTKTALAGDDIYDLSIMRGIQYTKLITSGALIELSEIPYVDFNNPWWDNGFLEAMSINDRKIAAVSDITMNGYLSTFVIFFNKDLIADYNLDDPNELVTGGTWTIDKLYSMSKTVAADLDSDGKYTNADQYGFTYIDDVPQALLNSFGVRMAELNSEGRPVITITNEDAYGKMLHLNEILTDEEVSYNCHARSKSANLDEAGMFVDGRVLFNLGGIYYGPEMREAEHDYGIIPYPKYNDEQTEYYMPTLSVCMAYIAVPVTNSDLENTGKFFEYYGYLGRRDLLPAFYDTLLQRKVARDDTSGEMLDLIFKNRFYDTGLLFDFGGSANKIRTMYHSLKNDFASSLAALEPKIEESITKLMDEMQK
ncbi:MAG: hypothetical protein ACYCWE_19540 [Eubacteriales bacterium]